MYSIAIIVFREFLEIALVLCVLLAATQGLAGRNRWIGFGILGGTLGAALIAFFTEAISNLAEGMGQEMFNASILLLAAAMVGWTVVWMRRHGKEMSQHIKRVGSGVTSGELPMLSLSIVVGLACLREGAEIVLFTYGQLASGVTLSSVFAGAAIGALAGIVVGFLIYLGLLRMATKYLFSVTGILLSVLAAGMAAQGAGFLAQAGVLPDIVMTVWDSSHILSEQSMLGQVLHVLIGYIAQPSGLQLVFYVATLLLIFLSLKLFGHPSATTLKPRTTGAQA